MVTQREEFVSFVKKGMPDAKVEAVWERVLVFDDALEHLARWILQHPIGGARVAEWIMHRYLRRIHVRAKRPNLPWDSDHSTDWPQLERAYENFRSLKVLHTHPGMESEIMERLRESYPDLVRELLHEDVVWED